MHTLGWCKRSGKGICATAAVKLPWLLSVSCSASWLCKTIVYASVLFLKQLDTRNICVRMCVCTVSAHAFCVACFYLLLLLFSQWALRRSSASCVVWWKCSVVFVFFGQDHKLFVWLVFDEAGSWLVITIITIVCVWYLQLLVGGLEPEFYFSIYYNNPNWLSYFSEGLKPPTRK